ncbi:MAG: hypothetical protein IJT34_05475 [Butyrivibrio sp.]|nr:hypothetical protein [Butyrivibrio sp.]
MSVVYLHIGTPKTGTTSLQAFLGMNRKELRKQGIDYPDGSDFLERPAYSRHHNGIWIRQCYGDPAYERHVQTLLERCDRAPMVLFSDEEIFRGYQKEPGIIRDLHQALKEAGHRMEIIVYLRRQDEYLTSLWAQKVKRFYTGSFDEWLSGLADGAGEGDYFSILEALAREVGQEDIHVRIYDKSLFTGTHTIYADFLSIFGIEQTPAYEEPDSPKNLSLQDVYLETKRRLNADPAFHVSKGIDKDSPVFQAAQAIKDVLVELQEEARAAHQLKNRSLVSAASRQKLLESYAESNEKTAQKYLKLLPQQTLFPPFDPTTVTDDIIPEEEIFEVMAQVTLRIARDAAQGQNAAKAKPAPDLPHRVWRALKKRLKGKN